MEIMDKSGFIRASSILCFFAAIQFPEKLASLILIATKRRRKHKGEMNKSHIMRLCDVIRETGFAIHRYHRNGHLEKIYENALAHRLRKLGLDVKQQHPIQVFDEDGALLGDFFADLFVENELIIELKAARAIIDEHVAQLLGYLRASRMEHGLMINFGASKFQIKKYILNDALPGFDLPQRGTEDTKGK